MVTMCGGACIRLVLRLFHVLHAAVMMVWFTPLLRWGCPFS